jgi:SMC interacting uncharacterized protein involved in chromosome segregation
MSVIDFVGYSKCKDRVKELERTIERLESRIADLDGKLASQYGAYQSLQYSCEGRADIYSSEIQALRQEIDTLKAELRKRGWEETAFMVAKA